MDKTPDMTTKTRQNKFYFHTTYIYYLDLLLNQREYRTSNAEQAKTFILFFLVVPFVFLFFPAELC